MTFKDWSETASDNDDADADINWTEGQAPSTVNGSARQIMAKLKVAFGHIINVRDYGALGDGSTDDSAAIIAAISAGSGKTVFFPEPASYYKLGSGLGTIPANTRLLGHNKRTTKIQRAFDGTQLMTLADGVSIENLYLDGDGATYSGKGLVISGTDGNQNVCHCRIINFNGNPVEFTATTAGSRSNWDNVEAWQTNGGTGTGNYAFVNADGSQLTAVPKSFKHIETSGFCAFSFGGSNDVFVVNSFLGDLAYTSNTRGVQIQSTRLANQVALTISGANNTIVGCDILAVVTISSGTTSCVLGPNSWNTAPFVIDSSGSNTNMVTHPATTYSPTLTQSAVNPTIGNATLTGVYTREGGRITASVNFVVGNSTSFGTGNFQFSLPVTRTSSDDVKCGVCLANDSGTPYTGVVEIPGAQAWCRIQRDGTALFTQSSPATWGTGDTIRLGFSYSI